MRQLLPLLFLATVALLPACGATGEVLPVSSLRHPLFSPENAYSVVEDPSNPPSIVPPETSIDPERFVELVESDEYELVTRARNEAAAQAVERQAALDQDAARSAYRMSADAMKLIDADVDPNDPNIQTLPDGNVLFRAIQADPARGIAERWFPLGGSHILARGLLDAKTNASTLETQREMYAGFFENLPALYITDRALPRPDEVQAEDVAFFRELNLQIAADWPIFIGQTYPIPAPAGYPVSWRDEVGAGTPLQPARGLDGDGGNELPSGLWSKVDFPLKWCATRVRDQGNRWLCAYFSVTAAVEARYAARRGRWVNLSEQFLYNQNKRVWNYDSDHGEAGWPSSCMSGMQAHAFGYPYEREWDYNRSLHRVNNTDGRYYERSCWANATGTELYPGAFCSDTNHQSPGICTLVDGRMYCATVDVGPRFRGGSSGISVRRWFAVWERPDDDSRPAPAATHDAIKLCLALKIPVTFCFGVPGSGFDNPDGICTIDSTAQPTGAHCVVLLGYIRNADLPTDVAPSSSGGYYIGKNSWGTDFGDHGYFYASEDWIDKYGAGMYAVAQVSG